MVEYFDAHAHLQNVPDLAPTPKTVVDLVPQMALITKHKQSNLQKALFDNAKKFARL